MSLLYSRGLTRLQTDAPTSGWAGIVATTVVLLILNDAWFYGWHRLLHHPRVFRYIHAVHHKSVDVNPFSSYSLHPLEALVMSAWVIPAVMFVPLHLSVLGAMQGLGLANNVMSHLGFEFLPRWLLRVPLLRWLNTATFHSLHHTQLNGNYGLQFRWWDRLFGTEVEGYPEAFVERGAVRLVEPESHIGDIR